MGVSMRGAKTFVLETAGLIFFWSQFYRIALICTCATSGVLFVHSAPMGIAMGKRLEIIHLLSVGYPWLPYSHIFLVIYYVSETIYLPVAG